MLTLWALAIILAVQAEALDPLTPPSLLPSLPVKRPLLQSGQLLRYPQTPKGLTSIERQSGTPKLSCFPVAKYFMSSSKLEDYLNSTLPSQIEKMLMCAELDMAGVLGAVLNTVSNLDLLSLLDITSSLNILGGGGLGGLLGTGSSSKSSSLPLPPLSKVTDTVSNLLPLGQGVLGSLLPDGVERDPVKKADSSLLSNLPLLSPLSGVLNKVSEPLSGMLNTVGEPLSGVLNTVSDLKESTDGILKSVVPDGISDALSGVLGNVNVKDLLLGLQVQKVTVENIMSTMTGDGILIQATPTAFIGGKGLLGPVISLLGFQVNMDMTLKIGISINNTQCVDLQVQDKDIKVNKVYLQLAKMVTDILPLPVPLPLDDVISQLLTVKMQENLKEAKSCDIDLSDFTECMNSTGLFKYYIKGLQTSPQGLSILYCASFNGKFLMLRSPLPPDPENANTSITLSNMMLREIVTLSAKQSPTEMNNLSAHIIKVIYFSLPDNKIKLTYWVTVKKDGSIFAKGLTRNEVEDVISTLMKKFLTNIAEFANQWNIPPGIKPLASANVEILKSRDLQAAE